MELPENGERNRPQSSNADAASPSKRKVLAMQQQAAFHTASLSEDATVVPPLQTSAHFPQLLAGLIGGSSWLLLELLTLAALTAVWLRQRKGQSSHKMSKDGLMPLPTLEFDSRCWQEPSLSTTSCPPSPSSLSSSSLSSYPSSQLPTPAVSKLRSHSHPPPAIPPILTHTTHHRRPKAKSVGASSPASNELTHPFTSSSPLSRTTTPTNLTTAQQQFTPRYTSSNPHQLLFHLKGAADASPPSLHHSPPQPVASPVSDHQ